MTERYENDPFGMEAWSADHFGQASPQEDDPEVQAEERRKLVSLLCLDAQGDHNTPDDFHKAETEYYHLLINQQEDHLL